MIPTTAAYKDKIKSNNRIFKLKITIEHSDGILVLTDKDIAVGTFTQCESSQSGEDFKIGGTVAADIAFTMLNSEDYEDIVFMGATVYPVVSILVVEGADAHFLQATQPSKMPGSEEEWADIPLGKFNIDYVKRLKNAIEIKALDDMINLDKPYELSQLSYPASLYQVYVNICNIADITVGSLSIVNGDYTVQERPSGELTLRDVLGFVAELSGAFAKINRYGALVLKWYTPTALEIKPENRLNFKPSDDIIQITGILADEYLAGNEGYVIDITDNPLLSGDPSTALPNIYNNVKDITFTPYTADWQGDMSLEAGDIVKHIDRDGKEYATLVTKSSYKYRGKSYIEAKGLASISRGFKGSTNKRIAQIKRVAEKVIGDKLTTLEQAQLNATTLMANMLGGYVIEDNGILYVADASTLAAATKLWKWGIGGFGYSEDGGTTWKTAITADGSIVANLVAAGIITADMVQTGMLQSEVGNSYFDLDNGRLRISHGGSTYSQMDINGFGKNYGNGLTAYLNDMYVTDYLNIGYDVDTQPPPIRIYLPSSFYNRPSTRIITIGKVIYDMLVPIIAGDGSPFRYIATRTHNMLITENYTINPPYVDVYSWQNISYYDKNMGGQYTAYQSTPFTLIAIGQ